MDLNLAELRHRIEMASTSEDAVWIAERTPFLLDLVDGMGQRLEEAMNRKVLLNGMSQEQKAAIFDIKAFVGDALAEYRRAKGGSP